MVNLKETGKIFKNQGESAMKEIATPSTTKYILEKYHLNCVKEIWSKFFNLDVNNNK